MYFSCYKTKALEMALITESIIGLDLKNKGFVTHWGTKNVTPHIERDQLSQKIKIDFLLFAVLSA